MNSAATIEPAPTADVLDPNNPQYPGRQTEGREAVRHRRLHDLRESRRHLGIPDRAADRLQSERLERGSKHDGFPRSTQLGSWPLERKLCVLTKRGSLQVAMRGCRTKPSPRIKGLSRGLDSATTWPPAREHHARHRAKRRVSSVANVLIAGNDDVAAARRLRRQEVASSQR